MSQWRITSRLHPAPERKTLLALGACLELAQDALRREHPGLDCYPNFEPGRPLPPSETIARLLVERCIELHKLIHHYNCVIDWTMADDELEQDDGRDYPF